MKKTVNVLVVEDSEEDARLAMETLRRAGFDATHRRVQTAAELASALAKCQWDAVISDLQTPTLPGIDALKIFRSADLDIPFILTSSTLIEDIAVSAIKAGASDYIPKDSLDRLAPVLERELEETRMRAAHRQSQRDLIESEERFRSLTALSSDWYWEQDENLRFTYVSAGFKDKYSDALEIWVGRTLWDLPDWNTNWAAHRATIEARAPFHDVELHRFKHNGRVVCASISGEPKFDGEGRFRGYRGVGKDVTERVSHLEDLLRFRTAMDATGDAITLVNRTTLRFVEVNATAAEMLGYTREELLQMDPAQSSATTRDQIERAYDAIIASETRHNLSETQLRRKDGTLLHVESRQHAQRSGAEWIIVSVARDISERKEAEDKLRRLNRLYAMVSSINALVVRVRGRAELFKSACRIAVEQGEFEMAWIGVVDPSELRIVPTAWSGVDEQAMVAIKGLFSASEGTLQGKTLAARAIREKTAFVSNDVQNDESLSFGKRYAESGIRSMAILPLILSERAIGVLVLYTSKVEFFDKAGLRLLTELAGNVAFAVDHIDKQERLDYLAYFDALTGLANRRLFLDRVTQYIRSAADGGHKLALFLIDLEHFKDFNDTLGRPAGDTLLKLVAEWLTENAGEGTVLGRVDADRFVLALPRVTYEAEVARLIERTIAAFQSHPFQVNGVEYRIAAKVGVVLFPDNGEDADTLFNHAEAALKKAKLSGDRYLFYAQKMTEAVAGRLGLENRLRRALEQEEFVLHYQPKVNLASGRLTGAEALIRWNDPRSGQVPPASFIPVLEEIGLIHEVGRWALRKAVEEYQSWRRANLPAVRIAVNVSPVQLRNSGFIAEIEQVIGSFPDAGAGLELEITESLIMENVNYSILTLAAVRAMGITVAIDDFGTGFSSLSYLSRLPVDTLKIDRAFVLAMTAGPEGLALISVIINLAHALKLNVVAEGVEMEEQLRHLRLLNCDEIQGYLFGKAVPAEVFRQRYLHTRALARAG